MAGAAVPLDESTDEHIDEDADGDRDMDGDISRDTDGDQQLDPVLFTETGSSWWPVLWGPVFAGAGAGMEALTGPVHGLAWLLIGIGLCGAAAGWVRARRAVYRVLLTSSTLTQGRERLAVRRISAVDEVGAPIGARVLGGGWTVPRKTTQVPVRLNNGTVLLAWARDGEGLHAALCRLVEPTPDEAGGAGRAHTGTDEADAKPDGEVQ